MDVTFKFYFECLKFALNNKTVQDIPNGVDYKKLFKIATSQGVVVLLSYALKDKTIDLPSVFNDAVKRAVSFETKKDVQSFYDKIVVIKALEENGIDFMPMKGYFLKDMYPKTEMRYCSDCDILVDPKKLKQVKKVLLSLGLQIDHKDTHHDVFFFPYTKTIFEIHKCLFVGKLQKYFGIGFERAFLKEGYKHFYKLSKEDFYIAVLAHYAYHFETGAGVGVRALCDIKVFRDKNLNLDEDYLNKTAEKCGLKKFKEAFEKATRVVFENEESDEFTDRLLLYMIDSQMLSNNKKVQANMIAKKNTPVESGKKKIFIRKFFPKRETIYKKYKFIDKCKIFLPLGYLLKWLNGLKNIKNSIKGINDLKNVDDKTVREIRYIIKELDIADIEK